MIQTAIDGTAEPQTHVNAAETPAGLQASVVKIDITPDTPQRLRGYQERVSTGVHDRIHLRIAALHDGRAPFVLVSTDAASLSPFQYDRMASAIERRTGVGLERFWWSMTHTHSAPEIGDAGFVPLIMPNRFKMNLDTDYVGFVERALIDGVVEALGKLEPARLGYGWGFAQANINRRAVGADGKAFLGMNPDAPVDRRIGVIRVDKANGDPLLTIANYPIHGTVLGSANLLISADVAGVVAEYVEAQTGAPLLFINGAAGNQAPIYSGRPSPDTPHLAQFQVLLGDKILSARDRITHTLDRVEIRTDSRIVETPRRTDLEWPESFSQYSRTTDTGEARLRLPVRLLRINTDLAIWAAPLELFCEIALSIRSRSPYPYTFYFGYTNGTFMYLPTAEAWQHGGYETKTTLVTPTAAGDLTEAVLDWLHGSANP